LDSDIPTNIICNKVEYKVCDKKTLDLGLQFVFDQEAVDQYGKS